MSTSNMRLRSRTPEDRARLLRGQTSADADILTAEGVAKLLHCTIDAVMRIPEVSLPAHRVAGKHLLYLRDEVIEYVRRSPRTGSGDVIDRRLAGPLKSGPTEIRTEAAKGQFDFGPLRKRARMGAL